ncbi:MAG: hypothetical protein ABR509_01700 [Candidatus Limnocylindria bacterium]
MYSLGGLVNDVPVRDPAAGFYVAVAAAIILFGVLQLVATIGVIRRTRWGLVLAILVSVIGVGAGVERAASAIRDASSFGASPALEGPIALVAVYGVMGVLVLLKRRDFA